RRRGAGARAGPVGPARPGRRPLRGGARPGRRLQQRDHQRRPGALAGSDAPRGGAGRAAGRPGALARSDQVGHARPGRQLAGRHGRGQDPVGVRPAGQAAQ
ncbi:hypothetical protein LTR94_035850, partial [Friedmanniomyces endolithicus]